MKDLITVRNVRGYIDEQGTAWLNIEDVARGLGFVMVRKERVTTSGDSYESIRWSRVNEYLKEFGFIPTSGDSVKAGDYIPENIFYRLAMKAKNAVAEKFQALVADEILPAIRKTGSYSLKDKALTPCANVIRDISAVADNIQSLFAVKRGIALSKAIEFVGNNSNFKTESLKQLLPPAEHEIGYLNPTQIGQRLGGFRPQIVNKMLAISGLQYKSGKSWRLTERGANYGEEIPFTRNGHSDYQIRWNEKVLSVLN